MIGYYSYVIITLSLIYPHAADPIMRYSRDLDVIKQELRVENPDSTLSRMLLNILGKPIDIVCDKLDADKKRELCDTAMKFMITMDDDTGGFGSFSKTENETAVADTNDPYTCKPMPIEEMDMTKPMHWCNRRHYTKYQSDEIALAEGFYISGSQYRVSRAFIFTPSPPNGEQVILRAKMERVSLLLRAAL